jgi:hypothetical protein
MKYEAITTSLPDHIKFKFDNKCKYYDLDRDNVIAYLIQLFNNGMFDKEFKIPID